MENRGVNLSVILLSISIIFLSISSFVQNSEIKKLKTQVVALQKPIETKDKRLDEVIMKTSDGKEVTRILVYDSVAATVIKSIQQTTKETK